MIEMKVTVEISKYPFQENFEEPILDFIKRLNNYKFIKVKTNATATHIVGEYDEVMKVLQDEIKNSFEKYGKVVFVAKFINGALNIQ
jgi:uncharacterized protein YqgV (UPF0045/DUF77 family)